ncbi:MAG: phosphoribosyltransferase [Thaumarchaeota archaeon]|nr:MAG: phosphoribosyltransferase [Nitrososphaerota archaeon]HDD42536.1 phosphoribosyltransferase [Nitrososphaeria archaeon]
MIFRDRLDAGERLAGLLSDYEGERTAVIAIPRGGVEVGYVVASKLSSPLEVTVPRKIGSPADPELAVGAIAEDGTIYIDEEVSKMIGIRDDWIRIEAERELQEVKRRIEVYRGGKPLPSLKGYTILLVDDGIATGATIIATARFLRKLEPEKLVIAAPVAPPEAVPKLSREADDLRFVETPSPFFAIGQFYQDFSQLSDAQVLEYLSRVRRLV